MNKQTTIGQAVSVSGIGLHTGVATTVTFQPAEANHGIRFCRTDLDNRPVVKADVACVHQTQRSTTLKQGSAEVTMVEHSLAALSGLGIDNVLVEVDGPELPILDGSAMPYLDTLRQAGRVEQAAEREYFEISEMIEYRDEASGAEYVALPADEFHVTALIDFDSPTLGQQFAEMREIKEFNDQIAPARTFCFLKELRYLAEQNLIKGGDLDNAIVIVDNHVPQSELEELATLLRKPSVRIEREGILNTTRLRFKNEPARHKLLDVIGDLTLVGRPIKGKIVATKPGHRGNTAFAKLLKQHYHEQRKLKGKPHYDPTQEPVYTSEAITKILPHRYPFLMVDKIIEISDRHVVGVKNVTINEEFFSGHFPGNPVFPGVLQMEALAQTGGILALSQQEDPYGWDTYFLKMDKVKWRHMVKPGDTLLLKMEMMGNIRRGIIQMWGTAWVGNRLVSEGELTAQIVKRK